MTRRGIGKSLDQRVSTSIFAASRWSTGGWRGSQISGRTVWSQLNAVRGDLVGDGAGVAGHGGRVRVDLVEEQFQGAGDAGRGGLLEGDGDRGGGEGDGAGEAADDGLAGDGAVFVVVTR